MTNSTIGVQTVRQALTDAAARLKDAGVDGAMRDARLLLADALNVPPGRLLMSEDDTLSPEAAARFTLAVSARATRQPVSQIIGSRAFWGRDFHVTRDTLDPRPETETLIAEALSLEWRSVLDLGTGTGAILLTLLAEKPHAIGLGTDISEAALVVARRNAAAYGIETRFTRSDWLDDVEGQFDLVVSNPPYLAQSEMADVAPELQLWEPHSALTDGGDGLSAYRAICAGIRKHLSPQGMLLVEIGWQQACAVSQIFATAGADVQVHRDLDGRDRVIRAVFR